MADTHLNDHHSSADHARKCAVLNVEMRSSGVSLRSRRAIITLGAEDGTVDRVVIKSRDGIALLERLAFAFRSDLRRPRIEYGCRAWLSRNSILRAQAKLEGDIDCVYDQARRIVPDIIDFMNNELRALSRGLDRRKCAKQSQRIARRMRKAMLVLIDAMRVDT